MKKILHIVVVFFTVAGFCVAGFFLLSVNKSISIAPKTTEVAMNNAVVNYGNSANSSTAEIAVSQGTTSSKVAVNNFKSDLPPQSQLANPPAVIKGIYLTGWTAGSKTMMPKLVELIKNTELNAVVIDIKDYSGYVSYAMDVPDVAASGAENQIRIARPNTLIKELHDNGIYVIGRITDFQDPILAKAHPEWALKNKTTGAIWNDNHNLSWIDPAATPAWNYFASIGKDAFARGFDELNFDYIRFASDGSLANINYPYWDEKTPMTAIIADYFKFLRKTFSGEKISVDLFGLTTVNSDDMGIGQTIENAYKYFDYVCPMVYPSHYASGFIGYKNPANYPYQVISYSMDHALAKLLAMGNVNSTALSSSAPNSSTVSGGSVSGSLSKNIQLPASKLRPWLQAFNLGAVYTTAMIQEEKQAVYDTLDTATSSQYYNGWLLWDAANNYLTGSTRGALDNK